MSTSVPAGWYPDPSGAAGQRWWDGHAWTTTTRATSAAAPTHEPEATSAPQPPPAAPDETPTRAIPQMPGPIAAQAPVGGPPLSSASMGSMPPSGTPVEPDRLRSRTGLVVASVVVTMLLVGGGTVAGLELLSGDNAEPASHGDTSRAGVEATDGDGGQPAPVDDDIPAHDGLDESPDQGLDDGLDDTPRGEASARVITLDGRCTVEIRDEQATERLRPWEFAACEYAPVDPDRDGSWIVVVGSLNGDDFDEADARDRAAELGRSRQLLWSSHYASLNPNLWVIYEGPYPDEDSADAAASRMGSSHYARVLSDDEDDRYCLAADGCAGERDR